MADMFDLELHEDEAGQYKQDCCESDDDIIEIDDVSTRWAPICTRSERPMTIAVARFEVSTTPPAPRCTLCVPRSLIDKPVASSSLSLRLLGVCGTVGFKVQPGRGYRNCGTGHAVLFVLSRVYLTQISHSPMLLFLLL